jgi:Flp pilus assembly protein TadG
MFTVMRPLTTRRKEANRFLRQLSRSARGEQGSATIEVAVASAVLFSLVIGIMEISLALYTYNYVAESAREGARYAMVRGSTSCSNSPSLSNCNASSAEIQTYVQGLGFPGLTSSNITVTTTWLCASTSQPTTWSTCTTTPHNRPGSVAKVVVSYPFPISIPFWKSTTFTTTSTSQMVITQ